MQQRHRGIIKTPYNGAICVTAFHAPSAVNDILAALYSPKSDIVSQIMKRRKTSSFHRRRKWTPRASAATPGHVPVRARHNTTNPERRPLLRFRKVEFSVAQPM